MVETAAPYSQQAARIIRQFILDGRFRLGERLNEVELAAELGISRSPIREALRHLVREGLVELHPSRGAFVARFDAKTLSELYEIREGLEIMAVRLAALRADESDLRRLQQVLGEAGGLLNADRDAPYPTHRDFHSAIFDAAHNARLREIGQHLHLQISLARSRSGAQPVRAHEAYAEHLAIFRAVESKAADEAEATMRRHLSHALSHAAHVVEAERPQEDSALDRPRGTQPGD